VTRRLIGLLIMLGAAIAAPSTGTPVLAQGDCTSEAEPNETAELGIALAGSACITGTLPDADVQDLWLWTVSEADAARRWTFTVDGIPGTVTGVQVLPITSDAGSTPIIEGGKLVEVDSALDATGPATVSDLFIPAGHYVLGVGRTATQDGQPPASIDYRIVIEPGTPVPRSADEEPNDDPAQASPIHGALDVSGLLDTTADYYAWTLSEADAANGWQVSLESDVGSNAFLSLSTNDGQTLAIVGVGPDGRTSLRDLKLSPGTYIIQPYGAATPYTLSATATDISADPEPNNDAVTASPIVISAATTGRLTEGDQDVYRFVVDSTLAASLLDVRLLWLSGVVRSLCLSSSIETGVGPSLGCTQGPAGIALRNLLLSPGEYLVTVSGEPALDDPYVLRIDPTSAPRPDFETEPNGTPDSATPFTAGTTMRGRLDASESDVFRVRVEGVPQLWEADATGTRLDALDWLQADGTGLGSADVSADKSSASLTDLFLVPGDHWFRLAGQGGDYTFSLTPIGSPDPNSEREPNNDELHAEPLGVGAVRSGRLPSLSDTDVFRFSLEATEHVALTVDAPVDGSVAWTLGRDGWTLARRTGSAPGASSRYDAVLPPGDYTVLLAPRTPSEGRYGLALTREDPFALSADQEPNDGVLQAQPLPDSGAVAGRADVDVDPDWYALGSLDASRSLEVRADGAISFVTISDGTMDYPLTRATDADPYRSDPLPAGIPLYLHVEATGDYVVSVGRDGSFGQPGAPPLLPVDLTLSMETDRVAAYWSAGQRVDGSLTLTATGPEPEDLTLDAVTSHYAWTAAADTQTVHLEPGQSVSIPVTVRAQADVWADIPVRVTLRASDAAGRQGTAFVELSPGRAAQPVHPEQAWAVPDALLGGLDSASLALGAAPVVTLDADQESRLHDGVTPTGGGMDMTIAGLPVTLGVDLAGDEPIPVAGTILDPLAGVSTFAGIPRRFELLLSGDGVDYQVALTRELSPLPIEQSFVLPEPVMARFAQLRVLTTWGDTDAQGFRLVLGEWKVVASPGVAVGPSPLDIAAGSRGGHVSWMDPQSEDMSLAPDLLTQDPRSWQIYDKAGVRLTWVIGFQDDRAAQVTQLQWVDPSGSDPTGRMESVDLAISTVGPSGPWVDAGTWTLHRAADGSVTPFTFPEPIWARFVRFTGSPIPKHHSAMELPATLGVIERSTDASYRSILGQWGQGGLQGPREWLDPPSQATPADAPDDNDTPATADPLVGGQSSAGQVHIGEDVDWYALSVPGGDNSVTFTVAGEPTAGVRLALHDATGADVPMTFQPGAAPGSMDYLASVTGGAAYTLLVDQPPFSAVFSYDASTSMGPYLPFVTQALRVFTGGVVPGEESVQIQAFEEPTLLPDWSDDPYQLQSAAANWVNRSGSSGVEAGVSDASALLAGREGARAILLVTDAETSTYARNAEMWQELGAVRPQIFSVLVAGNTTPALDVHVMQDLAVSAGGVYQYARSHAEMDRAFDRMATWLRRPAIYTLSVATSQKRLPPPRPGRLSVVSRIGPDGAQGPVVVGKDVAIELVLDTSGSMLEVFGGKRRIDVAKSVLTKLVEKDLPTGAQVALRVFTQEPSSCASELAVPLSPLDPRSMAATIRRLRVLASVNTPLAAAITQVRADLAGVLGPRIVVVVSDGEENCGGSPTKAVRALRAHGVDVTLNVVGLGLDKKARKSVGRLANLGGGVYFDARNAAGLESAIRTATSPPFEVYDATGTKVAGGTVNGASLELDPGTYTVVVLTEPGVTFEAVSVQAAGTLTLQLP
jgi:hypothetical protein